MNWRVEPSGLIKDLFRAAILGLASGLACVLVRLLFRSLQRYLDAGLWARDPAMSEQGFERLGSSFLSGGALKRPPVFENCVDLDLV